MHDIRNHLAVAIANVEGFRDGVLEPLACVLGERRILVRQKPGPVAADRIGEQPNLVGARRDPQVRQALARRAQRCADRQMRYCFALTVLFCFNRRIRSAWRAPSAR